MLWFSSEIRNCAVLPSRVTIERLPGHFSSREAFMTFLTARRVAGLATVALALLALIAFPRKLEGYTVTTNSQDSGPSKSIHIYVSDFELEAVTGPSQPRSTPT